MSARRIFAAVLAVIALTGCAAADKNQPTTSAKRSSDTTAGMNTSMPGMGNTKVPTVNGVSPVPIRTLATAYWQDMEIQAQTMTPTPFVVVSGKTETMHRPPKGASFHLMIMLTDRHTHFQIPYASVWATIINSAGQVVYTGQQWPMISEYMGSHYGDNVPHIPPGRYTLKLLISPPQQGRHLEYEHMWQHQHTVIAHFTWKPTT